LGFLGLNLHFLKRETKQNGGKGGEREIYERKEGKNVAKKTLKTSSK